jgi:hypothetical protein
MKFTGSCLDEQPSASHEFLYSIVFCVFLLFLLDLRHFWEEFLFLGPGRNASVMFVLLEDVSRQRGDLETSVTDHPVTWRQKLQERGPKIDEVNLSINPQTSMFL